MDSSVQAFVNASDDGDNTTELKNSKQQVTLSALQKRILMNILIAKVI